MKLFKRVVLLLAVLLAILLIALMALLNPIVRWAATSVGTDALGVPVGLEDVDISLFKGRVELRGLTVANPPGFRSEPAFELGYLLVEVDMRSLLSDRVVIRRVLIEEPVISYEQTLKGSNLGRIQERLETETPKQQAEQAKAEPGRKVQINDLVMREGTIRAAVKGASMRIPLPAIHLQNIGAESEGATLRTTIGTILKAVLDQVGSVAGKLGDVLGKGKDALGDLAGVGIGEASNLVGKLEKELGRERLGAGVSNVLRGVGGLLKRDEAAQ